jgi:DNA-binding NtrC family response regulator
MTTIVQVEYRPTLLSAREDILQLLGHPVVSVLGSRAARNLDLSNALVGVVVIGHRAPRLERCELITYFRETLHAVPIVALLGRRDSAFSETDFNCPADNPPLWVKMVSQALAGVA